MLVNESSENVAKFTDLGTTITNPKFIHEDIKTNSGNACCHFCLPISCL